MFFQCIMIIIADDIIVIVIVERSMRMTSIHANAIIDRWLRVINANNMQYLCAIDPKSVEEFGARGQIFGFV